MRAGERAQLTRLADTESLAATVLEGVSEGLGLIESELVADSELVGVCDSEESQGIRRGPSERIIGAQAHAPCPRSRPGTLVWSALSLTASLYAEKAACNQKAPCALEHGGRSPRQSLVWQ